MKGRSDSERGHTLKDLRARLARAEEAEILAQAILNQVAEAIVVCDASGVILRSSQAALGLSPGAIPGVHFDKAFALQQDDHQRFSISAALQGEILQGFEVYWERPELARIDFLLSSGPLLSPHGKLLGCVVALIDISPRKRFEEELKRHSLALSRSNADLRQFAYAASHDLQEPLRMVSNFMRLLEARYRGKLDSDADEYIRFAVEGVTRMHALIDDLLSYTRVETKERSFAEVNSRVLVDSALSNLRITIRQSGARVTCGDMPTVCADGAQMLQVFQHLIANAIKFRGTAVPDVHLECSTTGRYHRFSVRDNGIGIEPEHRDRIFTIFQRLHARGDYPGNGVGLAICKRIVEKHGGQIWVSSTPHQGATFYFTLPIQPEASSRASLSECHSDPELRP